MRIFLKDLVVFITSNRGEFDKACCGLAVTTSAALCTNMPSLKVSNFSFKKRMALVDSHQHIDDVVSKFDSRADFGNVLKGLLVDRGASKVVE